MNKIAELNNQFRRGNSSLGITHTTCGVQALELDRPDQFARLLQLVREFGAFSEANDPYKERDLTVVELDGERYFFKIDYCDREAFAEGREILSEDPSDSEKTLRIGVLMRAYEY